MVEQLVINLGSRLRELRHQGEELQVCVKGKVKFTIRAETYLLRCGGSIRFESYLRHYWENVGGSEAQLLMICCPPIHMGRCPDEG